ncbi:MAG: hypothetical protein E7480_06630 [Ruminococcaceae bacterium]|nr:hypothetical protein [Oscillospiraceae bacterium]
MNNLKFKKAILYFFTVLPVFGFLCFFYLSNYISPALISIFITIYIVIWIFVVLYILKKIKKYNFYLLSENAVKAVKDIEDNNFFENCEKRFLQDGFEKNVDLYEDGETMLTATCFYKNTKTHSGTEGQIVVFLSGIKAFHDLINTENDLKNSILNCTDQHSRYVSCGQVVCILSPYPEPEIYNFCCENFYTPNDSIIFAACNTESCKMYYSLPKKIKNKDISKSVELIEKYIQ